MIWFCEEVTYWWKNEVPTYVLIFPFHLTQSKQNYPIFTFELYTFVNILSDFAELDRNKHLFIVWFCQIMAKLQPYVG